jgi:hypothetical protein
MDPRHNGHGRRETPGVARGWRIAIVIAIVLLLALALVGGFLILTGNDDPEPSSMPVALGAVRVVGPPGSAWFRG